MNDLTNEFWDEFFRADKIKNRNIYNWLNKDNLNGLITDGKVFWIELVGISTKLPNYIRKFIINWAKRKGYKYLYN